MAEPGHVQRLQAHRLVLADEVRPELVVKVKSSVGRGVVAADLIEHAGHRRHGIAQYDSAQLDALLARIHEWEDTSDPDVRHLPCAKRHDDKTIAALAWIWM